MSKAVDQLANERTFLAWMRTALGIMAFGFVVEKFTLFMKQFAIIIAKNGPSEALSVHSTYASVFGITLVLLGGFIAIFSFFTYKRREKQIEKEAYVSFTPLALLLTVALALIAMLLAAYLIYSDYRMP